MSYFEAQLLPLEIAERYNIVKAEMNQFWDRGEMVKVEKCLWNLWQLLPDPKFIWSESLVMVTGMALHFLKTGQIQKALDWVPNLIGIFETTSDSYPAVVVGQVYFEAGQQDEAIKWFHKAFDVAGKGAFRGENSRFLELVTSPKIQKKTAKPKLNEWPQIPDPEAFKLMTGPLTLDNQVHEQINKLCAAGDALAETEEYDASIAKYREALFLLPRPIEKWEASTWIYIAIGDALFLKGDYLAAVKPLRDVMFCPGAEHSGFIRLRRGQVAFEKGDLPMAEKELAEAYRLEGEKIFSEDDPKYLKFIKAKLPR
jgi:tetratricopeptide (TPR) repeat protein